MPSANRKELPWYCVLLDRPNEKLRSLSVSLKWRYTFGNHSKLRHWTLLVIVKRNLSCEIILKRNTRVTRSCVLSDAWFRDLKLLIWSLEIKLVENYFFLKNYVVSKGAVSHNVLYDQPLPITRYQVRFYANNSFE